MRSGASPEGVLDLRGRRARLYEIHSFLRSVDNLRPDEALDELAKLYEAWAEDRSFETAAATNSLRSRSELSFTAQRGAVERLKPLLESVEPGHSADLFQELADVGVRVGMGQYFTPLPVAEAIARFLEPARDEHWLDPFCGSSLLLGAIARASDGPLRLYGIDRDPRVLHLSEVEAKLQHPESDLALLHENALSAHESLLSALGAPPLGVDGIVANPPFGAGVHATDRDAYADFELLRLTRDTPLEILGLEQCIRLLRPGGRLGIVLPQSVLSNKSHRDVRALAHRRCRIDGVLSLAADTFLPFKGVGKAAVLFLTRRHPRLAPRPLSLGISRSIGWDSTGRANGGSDLLQVVDAMKARVRDGDGRTGIARDDADPLRNLTAEWLLRPATDGTPLSELTLDIFVGRTPPRSAYELDGCSAERQYRVLKVGDLTGAGVDWKPGARSIANLPRPPKGKQIRVGDILTTAAAHHPRYIGAKVDIIDTIPQGLEGRCMPVAEVMVLRVNPEKIDPYVLLLWLRTDEGREALQMCVTGQTAHLHPQEVREVIVPKWLFDVQAKDATRHVKRSLSLRRQSEAAAANAVELFHGACQGH